MTKELKFEHDNSEFELENDNTENLSLCVTYWVTPSTGCIEISKENAKKIIDFLQEWIEE